jgi:hypothetical protein
MSPQQITETIATLQQAMTGPGKSPASTHPVVTSSCTCCGQKGGKR